MTAKRSNVPAKWDEELARFAAESSSVEAGAITGQFISLKGGIFTYNDQALPGNTMCAVILDHVLENVYYPDKYDPDNPAPPTCYAFGRELSEMKPHDEASDPESEECQTCPQNVWGSGDRGRSKACRNTRRLALIPGGSYDKRNDKITLFKKESDFEGADIAYIKLPVTSVRGFTGYVRQLTETLKRPPFGVYTRLTLVPDEKTTFKLHFENVDLLPNNLIKLMIGRHEEAKKSIIVAYQGDDGDSKKTTRKKRGSKKTTKKKTGSRQKF